MRQCGIFRCGLWDPQLQTPRCSIVVLVPRPGTEPEPSSLGAWSLSHRTTREDPGFLFRAMKMFQNGLWWRLHLSASTLNTTELLTLNAGMMWCVNYISIKLLLIYIYVFSQLPLCSPSQHAQGLIIMWSLSS